MSLGCRHILESVHLNTRFDLPRALGPAATPHRKTPPRRERREELARIESLERHSRRQLERLEGELREMPDPGDAARREFAVVDQVLAERRQLAITAAQIVPPPYIKQELGARPVDPAKQKAWDRGVEAIETYRQRYGVKDPHRALGREREQQRLRETLRLIREAQRTLGLGQHAARKRNLGRLLGIGR